MTTRTVIQSSAAPKAIGPYSQAITANGMVFCSGSIPLDPTSMDVVAGGVVEQTHQVIKNLSAVLNAAGSDLSKVVKTTVFLKNMSDFAAMNGVYATYFTSNPPARSTVEVARLPRDVLVEIECIALV
jgi:2-iminobutanoate/2-iminopropanoate deaminase